MPFSHVEQFKYAGGVGGQIVPFLPAARLGAFGLSASAFADLGVEREPMYPVTDVGVHLSAIKESIVRAYKRCAHLLRRYPEMYVSWIVSMAFLVRLSSALLNFQNIMVRIHWGKGWRCTLRRVLYVIAGS